MAFKSLSRLMDHFAVVGPQRAFFQNPRSVLRDFVKPDMIALDIGCGTGFFSLPMAKMVGSNGKVICVDLKADAIKDLESKSKKARLTKIIEARVCSDSSLGIDDLNGKIDFALAFYVLHHASGVAELMIQIHDVLKPDGAFLIVEPKHHVSVKQRNSIESLAQKAGFVRAGNPKIIRSWAVLFKKN
jgi:ubiquinone/menaquinone biosynthesis C-methylase UbiE